MSIIDESLLDGVGVFTAIVQTGSFAAAGDYCNMSQPGVSRAVARLEKRLGVRLFDRTTRVVSLTDEGRNFHEKITPLLVELEEITGNVSASATAAKGRLRVNVDPLFSQLMLWPALEAFLFENPDLTLELNTRDQLGDMIGDGFDLAIRFGIPQTSSLIAKHLLSTRIVTVASPAYAKKRGKPKHPNDIVEKQHTTIEFRNPLTGKPYTWEFHRGREKIIVPTNGRVIVNDGATMISACITGYGMAQMLELVANPLLKNKQLIELLSDWPDETFPLYAYYPSRRYLLAKTRAFLDFVISLTR